MHQQGDGAFAQSETAAIACVWTSDELRNMFRTRIASLGVTFETADTIAGLPAGYTAKLLGPGPMRRFGPIALEALVGAKLRHDPQHRMTQPHIVVPCDQRSRFQHQTVGKN